MNDCIIAGLQVYTEHGVLSNGGIAIRDGKIHTIDSIDAFQNVSAKKTFSFPTHYHLVPGFIDLHVHGAQRHDVMDGTPESLHALRKTLAANGTTAFLATTMTSAPDTLETVLKTIRNVIDHSNTIPGATILGVHCEGPYISAKKAGAQLKSPIRAPNLSEFMQWQQISGDAIRLITIAPEWPHSADFIHALTQQGVAVSMGHSDASYEEAISAISAGIRYATHVCNAMRTIHHRDPGIALAALLSPDVTTEIIVDDYHLHPAIIQMITQLKGLDHIVLVSDAMRACCLGDGEYELGGQTVRVCHGKASLHDGTLAGSVLTLCDAIRNFSRITDFSLAEILKCVTANPAKILGIDHRKGSLSINKDADCVVLDDSLRVVMTLVHGEVVFHREFIDAS